MIRKIFAVSGLVVSAVIISSATAYALKINIKGKLEQKLQQKQQQQQAQPQQQAPAAAAAPAAAVAAPAAAPAAPGPATICNAATTMRLCYAFTGPKNAEQKVANGNQMACKFMKGQYLPSGTCPNANALGRCRIQSGQPDEYTLYYYAGGRMTAANAQADCVNPKSGIHVQGAGQWSPL